MKRTYPKGTQDNMNSKEPIMQPLLNVKEVAQLLNVSPHTVYKMKSYGQIPAVKIGGALKFEVSAIQAWLKTKTLKARPSQIE